ncbi:hypothetical protein [Pseudomonas sp. NPDC089406]|uniref:hypothetical protein n=1 Tax=Pseudomonas sp. NPDC089406 TaxID=3364463 RepID=UPI003850EB81
MEFEVMGQPSLEDWNFQVLMLVQALTGAVSANFRMVLLLWDGRQWVLRFYIEEDIEEDIDEIEDVVCQYTAYQDCHLECCSEIIVGNGSLSGLAGGGRVVYRRRESSVY